MGLASLKVDPAARTCAGLQVQSRQLANPQATAVEQFNHGRVARFEPGISVLTLKTGELHGLIHTQSFRQWLTIKQRHGQ